MNNRLQDKIDLYHAGRLNSEEATLLEMELAKDPSLQSESDFQNEIIDGLKNYRKSELKTRLEAVDISPTWFEFVQQSTLLKSFSGVAVATLVGTGVFFLAEPVLDEVVDGITIDAPIAEAQQLNWTIEPEELTYKTAPISDKIERIILENSTEPKLKLEQDKESQSETFDLSFDSPGAEDVKDEDAPEIASLDKLPENNGINNKDAEHLRVDHESVKTLNIKYKYYDGKLFLSGDFDRAPYEILEINSADGRRIYVKYLDTYYKVNTTDRLTALPVVKNVRIIEELNLLRQNK